MIIRDFNTESRILIVAEIGNNHEGSFEIARQLVIKAAECGVDAVKFQTFRTEHYVSKSDEARFSRLKSFELSFAQFAQLSNLAKELGLLFISTPFDLASAEFLEHIVDAYKIASGDNNFYPLLEVVARTGKPVIISTGVSDFEQVAKTISFVTRQWNDRKLKGQLALLHCVSSYPVAPGQANLRSMQCLAENFDHTIGYSDHTLGLDAALLAVALGARIIEKHFTLDHNFSGFRDHQLSADPKEMLELVQRIRNASAMLGKFEKVVQPDETGVVANIRRSIVAAKDLRQGHALAVGDLTWTRPAGGLPPGEEDRLIGRKLKHDFQFGEKILATDVEAAAA